MATEDFLAKSAFDSIITSLENLKTQMEALEAKAQKWAEENENVEVETGLYSAKHHSLKSEAERLLAEAAKLDAQTAETNALTSADNASTSESNAATSATNAATSESNAATSETNAQASENKAQQWADQDENVEVETGKYSAKHHALKAEAEKLLAEAAKLDAQTAETNALTSANNASTSETNAAASETNAQAFENKAQQWAEEAENVEIEAGLYSSKHHSLKAAGHKVGAQTAESNAQTSESNASTSEANALASENKARKWAEENEDVEVEIGKFSAKHHSLKSESHKLGAQTSETNAATSESNAAISEANALTSEQNASSHETKAQQWAEQNEDVEVETGKYSAKHHALKAEYYSGFAVQGIQVQGRLASTSNLPASPFTGEAYVIDDGSGTDFIHVWDGSVWIDFSVGSGTSWGEIQGTISNQTDLQNALSNKVDVVAGKGLSTEDFTTTLLNKLTLIESEATADQSDAEIESAYNTRVLAATQSEAETGTETGIRRWSPLRVRQAVDHVVGALTKADVGLGNVQNVDQTNAENLTSGLIADARISQSSVTQHQAALSITKSQISDFGNYALVGHNHSATDITSGTFADARIAQSNVTQHQGALSIGWAQLTGVPTYDNYQSWNLKTNNVQRTIVGSGGDLDIVGGANVSVGYGAGGVVTISSTDTNTQLSNEQVQDIVGAMFSGNTESRITATYQDADGTIDLAVDANLSSFTNDVGYITSFNNYYLSGLSFNTATGILTATVTGATNQTVDLDGRYALTSHNHAASNITSGTFADARIAQSNVTQHQGALNIGVAQITPETPTSKGSAWTASASESRYYRYTGSGDANMTINSGTYDVGEVIYIEQAGAGVVTVVAGASVAVNGFDSGTKTGGQYDVIAVKQVSSNTWTVIGGVA